MAVEPLGFQNHELIQPALFEIELDPNHDPVRKPGEVRMVADLDSLGLAGEAIRDVVATTERPYGAQLHPEVTITAKWVFDPNHTNPAGANPEGDLATVPLTGSGAAVLSGLPAAAPAIAGNGRGEQARPNGGPEDSDHDVATAGALAGAAGLLAATAGANGRHDRSDNSGEKDPTQPRDDAENGDGDPAKAPAVAGAANLSGSNAHEADEHDPTGTGVAVLGSNIIDAGGNVVGQAPPVEGFVPEAAKRDWKRNVLRVLGVAALVGLVGHLLTADSGPTHISKMMVGPIDLPGHQPTVDQPDTPVINPDAYTGEKYLWNEAAKHVGTADATPKLMHMVTAAEAMGMQADVVPVYDNAGHVTGYSVPQVVTADGTHLASPGDKWTALDNAENAYDLGAGAQVAPAAAHLYWDNVGARV